MKQSRIKPPIILVIGMHRSGTSVVAQMVAQWGAYMGEKLFGANKYNKDGYWEYVPLVQLNEKIFAYLGKSWLFPPDSFDLNDLIARFGDEARQLVDDMDASLSIWCWKDPRIVFLLPFWKKILEKRKLIYVVTARNPIAIADSLKKRDDLSHTVSLSLLECTAIEVAQELKEAAHKVVVEYESLLSSQSDSCEKIFNFLNEKSDEVKGAEELNKMRNVVKPLLRSASTKNEELTEEQFRFYDLFRNGNFESIIDIPKKKSFNAWEVLKYFSESNQNKGFSYQVYFQTDKESFSESKSILKNYNEDINQIDIDLSQIKNINLLRFDPLDDWVVIRIEKIELKTNKGLYTDIKYSSNAFNEKVDVLVFNNADPQVLFDLSPYGNLNLAQLTIYIKYIAVGDKAKAYFANFFGNQLNEVFDKLDIKGPTEFTQNSITDSIALKINAIRSEQELINAEHSHRLNHLKDELSSANNQIEITGKQIIDQTDTILELKQEAILHQTQIEQLNNLNQNLQQSISDKNAEIRERDFIINDIKANNETLLLDIYNIQNTINENATQINKLNNELDCKKEAIDNLNIQINQFKQTNLKQQLEIDAFKNSITFKIIQLLALFLLIFKPRLIIQKFKTRLLIAKQTKIINESRFFDSSFYLKNYPDVAKSRMRPAMHYLLHGGFEGRNPSDKFNSKYYLTQNEDVCKAGLNPLLHFVLYGQKEGRAALFEQRKVEHQNVDNSPIEKKEQLIEIPNIKDVEIKQLIESGLFDNDFYYEQYSDIRNAGIDGLKHYYEFGWKERRNPNRSFDTFYYLESNKDVKKSGINPLLHYILYGKDEGRPTNYKINVADNKVDSYEDARPLNITDYELSTKVIAFHLPQFHTFKENNEWWGEGFTEWTNVTKAQAQFEGHYQPRLPGVTGFYDLRLPEVLAKQAQMAKAFGVYGFCFHHYYFAGKRLMEIPVNNLLAHPEIDLPFCLCWANENWTRRWDGLENDILIAQDHSPDDDIRFLNDIEKYFLDPRYIRVDNKPLFIVYKANQFPDMKATIKRWRNHWREKSGGELHIVMAMTFGETDPLVYGFDAAVEFPPHNIGAIDITNTKNVSDFFEGKILSYQDFMSRSLISRERNFELYKTVFPGWDNTARRNNNASIFADGSASLYKYWLRESIKYAKRNLKLSSQFVFINAWNEWAEGAHLEPCQKLGYCYLNATARAIEETEGKHGSKVSVIVPNYNHAKYLNKRLDSIYNQSYKNIEVILLDDCSSDESQKILLEYASKYSKITRTVFNEKNSGGVFHQWAKGINLALGDLVWIAESDDFCDADFLDKLVDDFEDESVMLSYSNCEFVDENGNSLNYYGFQDYIKDVSIKKWKTSYIATAQNEVENALGIMNTIPNVSGVVFRRPVEMKLLSDKKWLSMKVAGDWIFYLHIILGGKIAFNRRTNNYFRRYKGSASETTYTKKMFYEEVGRACATIAALYKVSDSLLKKNRNNFLAFYKSQVDNNEVQFNEWFNFEKVNEATSNRLPSVMVSIYGFYPGGAEIMPIRLANELKRKGVSVLLHSCGASDRNLGIKSLVRNDIPIIKTSDTKEIHKIVNDFGIDIVNSHHWHFQQFHLKNADFVGENCKHIGTLHGIIESDNGDYKISEDDLRLVDKFIDTWTYVADKNIVPFIEAGIYAKSTNKFHKIPNGIEMNEVTPIDRSKINIPDEAFVLCTVSRAIKEKGWKESIESVGLAREITQKDIRLILIGDGPVYDELKETGIPEYVYMPGFISNPIAYYAASDMGILLSTFRSESFPLTIIECLSVGKPLIVSNIGEIKYILSSEQGIAGEVFDVQNWIIPTNQVAKIISGFVNSSDKYQKVQRIANSISSRYSLNNVADQYLKFYAEAANKAKKTVSEVPINKYDSAFNLWKNYSDNEWYSKITHSLKTNEIDGVKVGFTDKDTQVNLTGRHGESTLFQAFNFYKRIKHYANLYGTGINEDTAICDFACGWGRITRFFLKETNAKNLMGLDSVERFIDICKQSIPIIDFRKIPAIPPYHLNKKFDLICAFSLFSHLNEPVAFEILKEFHAMLNNGGMVIFTSRGSSFIDYCDENRKKITEESSQLQKDLIDCFSPALEAKEKYKQGIFQFFKYPGDHASSNYGEAAMPKQWVVKRLSHLFELLAFEDENIDEDMDQTLIVIKKRNTSETTFLKNAEGFCPVCEENSSFVSSEEWLRDNYRCIKCNSIPRQRYIKHVVSIKAPNWKELSIHESSPSNNYFSKYCKNYSSSFYFPNYSLGVVINNKRNENIEKLSFNDNSFDIFITQEVLEHIFHPENAINEMLRVVKPNGYVVFTTPIYKNRKTFNRALIDSEHNITHIVSPEYHGNPIDNKGSLVTWDYGTDFFDLIKAWVHDGIVEVYNSPIPEMGIEGEFLDVYVIIKRK